MIDLPGSTSGRFIEAGNEVTMHIMAVRNNMTMTGLKQRNKSTRVYNAEVTSRETLGDKVFGHLTVSRLREILERVIYDIDESLFLTLALQR